MTNKRVVYFFILHEYQTFKFLVFNIFFMKIIVGNNSVVENRRFSFLFFFTSGDGLQNMFTRRQPRCKFTGHGAHTPPRARTNGFVLRYEFWSTVRPPIAGRLRNRRATEGLVTVTPSPYEFPNDFGVFRQWSDKGFVRTARTFTIRYFFVSVPVNTVFSVHCSITAE